MSASLETQRPGTKDARALPWLQFHEVTKTFDRASGAVTAVGGVTLDIPKGQFVAVLGPSGCGKSTLMALAAGLYAPTSGSVRIEGNLVKGPYVQAGIVFQKDLLLEWRTVRENVLLQVEMRGLDPRPYVEVADRWLERVGLGEFKHHYPSELSGGMRQRAALCRSLIHSPTMLLLDEPFGALDALTREQMNLDLQRLWMESHTTIFLITHSISEAVFLADRVIVMSPRPAKVIRDIPIDLPRPRDFSIFQTPAFNQYTQEIREEFMRMGVLKNETHEEGKGR